MTLDEDGFPICRVQDVRRASVDTLFGTLAKLDQEAFEAGKSRHTLIDIRYAGWPTPYAVAELIDAAKETPAGLRESIAILVAPNNLAFRLVETMLSKLTKQVQKATRVFTREDEAMRWLHERP